MPLTMNDTDLNGGAEKAPSQPRNRAKAGSLSVLYPVSTIVWCTHTGQEAMVPLFCGISSPTPNITLYTMLPVYMPRTITTHM